MDREHYTAFPVSGKNKIEIDVFDKEAIPRNKGHETKLILTGDLVKGQRTRRISLVERGLKSRQGAKDLIRKWVRFKEAGLPVVKTLRKTEKETVLLTNVTADGTEVFGKAFSSEEEVKFIRRQGRNVPSYSAQERIFLDTITDRSIESIRSKALEYADIATQNRIVLPTDDAFELLIHPDKSLELIILDLAGGYVYGDLEDTSIKIIGETNRRNAINFVNAIKNINEILRNKKDYLL